MAHAFFVVRLVLYMLAFLLPIVHPAIAVPYDWTGYWLWFALVPAEMIIANYLSPPRFKTRTWLLAGAGAVLVFLALVSHFDSYTPLAIGVGVGAFAITALVFKTGEKGQLFVMLEQLFLVLLYFRMLSFSRSSEAVAREATGVTQLIMVLIIGAFLLHGLVMYLYAFHRSLRKRNGREVAVFAGIAIPLVLAVAFLLPPDFVSHQVALNRLRPEPEPELLPADGWTDSFERGNLRGNRAEDRRGDQQQGQGAEQGQAQGQEQGQGGQSQGKEPSLQGIPSDEWSNSRDGEGQGQSNSQYAVMVVASALDPIYAAEAYRGVWDSERGFRYSDDNPLNELTYKRMLDTWENDQQFLDRERRPQNVYFLSTIPERVIPYVPEKVEPTVLNRRHHPFDYSYSIVSGISRGDEQDWLRIGGLSEEDRARLAPYLEIELPEGVSDDFRSFLDEAVGERNGYFGRIDAILRSFEEYQYEIGYDEDVSTSKMHLFLTDTMAGDCTEFSNTAAILGRLAGVPSRVVTGYLASEGLQTNAHVYGLLSLRENIEQLNDFPLDNLYLVTTAHRHSWVQYYMPGYGWVDFETTAYAIPPMGSGDPNAMDVIIPILENQEQVVRQFVIPWGLILRSALIVSAVVLVGLYSLRYGTEAYLGYLVNTKQDKALPAMYQLLLMKLASCGYEVKKPSETPREYSEEHPEVEPFAELYTTLRYRENIPELDRSMLYSELQARFVQTAMKARRPGLKRALARLFSLKGLYYR